MFDTFETFFEAGHSGVLECLALFLVPYVHEDVAILGGSILVVEQRLPLTVTLICLYAGMVSSDVALYGLGALARRSAWVRGKLLSPRIERLMAWLNDNVIILVIIARFIPGFMFPLYIGCGLSRVAFPRFVLTTAIVAAFYLALIFAVFSAFGAAMHERLGAWTWPIAGLVLVIPLILWLRGSGWLLVFRASRRGTRALFTRDGQALGTDSRITHQGMPAIGHLPRSVARAERIPPILFYIPLVLQWLWLGLWFRGLSLPAIANPTIEVGRLWGESKSACLDMVGTNERKWLANYASLSRKRVPDTVMTDLEVAKRAMVKANLSFPLVAKPDIGRRGFGVRRLESEADLVMYLEAYPGDEVVILQQLIPFDGEAGVLYARRPGEPEGHIEALALRYFPHVIGDGQTPLRDLILSDQRAAWKSGTHFGLESKHLGLPQSALDLVPDEGELVRLSFIGSNRVGGLYRDAREHITPALARRFDEISRSMPEFHYGRYDIRFESIEQLREGHAFSIIEINGAGGEVISAWDPQMPLVQVYRELLKHVRLLFEIGAANRARGFRPPGILAVLKAQWRQYGLIRRYPPSN